jgi:hypothetical protein
VKWCLNPRNVRDYGASVCRFGLRHAVSEAPTQDGPNRHEHESADCNNAELFYAISYHGVSHAVDPKVSEHIKRPIC